MVPERTHDVYGTFAGFLDQAAVARFFDITSRLINGPTKQINLLLQSTGGVAADGLCLHNYFKTLPVEICVYNAGSVCSAAVLAYLGAHRRYVATNASFLLHRCYYSPQRVDAANVAHFQDALVIDDDRMENALRKVTRIPEERWAIYRARDLLVSAKDAVEFGIADEIGYFSPPAGSPIFNV